MLPKTAWLDAFNVQKPQRSEKAATAARVDLFMNVLPRTADRCPTEQGNAESLLASPNTKTLWV
jgi:hypothetical protein